MGKPLKYLVSLSLFVACSTVNAENLGFSCEGEGAAPERMVWRYNFEIDQQTSKGIQRGLTYGGRPYSDDIEVVFTPARMQIRKLGAQEFTGYIDRRDLSFNFGGSIGSCKIVPVEKIQTKF